MMKAKMTLDSEEITSILFHPRKDDYIGNQFSHTKIIIDDTALCGLWFDNPASSDVVLFFHGNGELASDWSAFVHKYAIAFNASIWIVDYRGYGQSEGTPSYNNLLTDAVSLFNALDKISADNRRRPIGKIYLFGRSIGSAPAIHLAWYLQDKITALVIDSGFSRISNLLMTLSIKRGVSIEGLTYSDSFIDNIDKLKCCQTPILFLHGNEDSLVSKTDAEDNFNASLAEKKELICVPKAGHNNLALVGGDNYWLSISSFLDSL